MAVEAKHLNLFPQQLITNRDFINTYQENSYPYNIQMGSGFPLTTTTAVMPEALLHFHQQSFVCDSVLQTKTSMKSDSGLTYNLPAPRKRSRDSLDQYTTFTVPEKNSLSQFPSFLGDDISLQIQQNQLEMDNIITQHTKKLKMEIEERQKQQARVLVSAIGEGVMKKLNEKDELIQRIGKLNFVLHERVKSLHVENQLWRNLAQTNEATANSLRNNLEQVLAHVSVERLYSGVGFGGGGTAVVVEEDVESCCGSSDYGKEKEDMVTDRCTLAREAHDKEVVVGGPDGGVVGGGGGGGRLCRKCWERESCVLLLPCRHLCLCTTCGSTLLNTCPVCHSSMNATLHVNMS